MHWQNRRLAYLAATALLCCAGLAAQAGEPISLDGADGLQAGGGEDGGGQFPEGTEDCSGDRHHHAHEYPANLCVFKNNPHFATTLGGGEACQSRARRCESCYNCCGLQRNEAEKCHCFGSGACLDAQADIERTCRHACFGQFTDGCTANP